VLADARRGYSGTYMHLGRKAPTMIVPDTPFPTKVSFYHGGLHSDGRAIDIIAVTAERELRYGSIAGGICVSYPYREGIYHALSPKRPEKNHFMFFLWFFLDP
jgi:hypothetical protein